MSDSSLNISVGLCVVAFLGFLSIVCYSDQKTKQEAIINGCNNYGNGIIICKGELK